MLFRSHSGAYEKDNRERLFCNPLLPYRTYFAAAEIRLPRIVHAVSVGETAAVLPLLRQCAAAWPEVPILLTHGTPTGRATGALRLKDLPGRIAQSYLPYDLPGAVERFFQHWCQADRPGLQGVPLPSEYVLA